MINIDLLRFWREVYAVVLQKEERYLCPAILEDIITGGFNSYIQMEKRTGYIGNAVYNSPVLNEKEDGEFIYVDKRHIDTYETAAKQCYDMMKRVIQQIYDYIHENPNKVINSELSRKLNIYEVDRVQPYNGYVINNLLRIILNIYERSLFRNGKKSSLEQVGKKNYSYHTKHQDINSIENIDNLCTFEYAYVRNLSKGEIFVSRLLDKMNENIIYEWNPSHKNYRLPNYPLSKWDFIIYDKNEKTLIGFIEVDGEQHYKQVNFFQKHREDFDKRLAIDDEKDLIALTISQKPILRLKSFGKKNYENQWKQLIEDWISLT